MLWNSESKTDGPVRIDPLATAIPNENNTIEIIVIGDEQGPPNGPQPTELSFAGQQKRARLDVDALLGCSRAEADRLREADFAVESMEDERTGDALQNRLTMEGKNGEDISFKMRTIYCR